MSSQVKHRQALPASTERRVQRRLSGAAGVHADQNRRRGGKQARGGRQGERRNYRNGEW